MKPDNVKPMNSSASNEDGDHGFQIAPMVDIVFVLLLFFMTYKNVREMHVEATPAGHPQRTEFAAVSPPIFIDINGNDDVLINGRVVATGTDHGFDDLRRWLAGIRNTSSTDESFVIRAQDTTHHERVVRVLGVLKKAGYKKVSFA